MGKPEQDRGRGYIIYYINIYLYPETELCKTLTDMNSGDRITLR